MPMIRMQLGGGVGSRGFGGDVMGQADQWHRPPVVARGLIPEFPELQQQDLTPPSQDLSSRYQKYVDSSNNPWIIKPNLPSYEPR